MRRKEKERDEQTANGSDEVVGDAPATSEFLAGAGCGLGADIQGPVRDPPAPSVRAS